MDRSWPKVHLCGLWLKILICASIQNGLRGKLVWKWFVCTFQEGEGDEGQVGKKCQKNTFNFSTILQNLLTNCKRIKETPLLCFLYPTAQMYPVLIQSRIH